MPGLETLRVTFEEIAWIKAAAPAVWFAAIFAAERVAAAVPAQAFSRRIVTNGAFWVLLWIVSPLIGLPLTAYAAAHPLWVREGAFASWPFWAVDFVILDCWAYWLHRACHETPLWRLHAPHHLDEHLDSTSAGRFHPGEMVFSALIRMPLIMALAIPFAHVIVFDAILFAASIFHHSNLRLAPAFERKLSRIVVTPSIHWVHHHAIRRDTDSNYAAILSLWDRLFASRSPTTRTTGMKIGVEGLPERPLGALLVAPFRGRLR